MVDFTKATDADQYTLEEVAIVQQIIREVSEGWAEDDPRWDSLDDLCQWYYRRGIQAGMIEGYDIAVSDPE